MSRPNKIRIAGFDYDIVWRDGAWSQLCGYRGLIDYLEQRIDINGEMKPIQIADTFLHELIHGVVNHYTNNESLTSEQVAEYCAAGIVMVWRDNPAAFAWWQTLLV